jgi:hypothetical protein
LRYEVPSPPSELCVLCGSLVIFWLGSSFFFHFERVKKQKKKKEKNKQGAAEDAEFRGRRKRGLKRKSG